MGCKGWYSSSPKASCLTLGNWNIVNNSAYTDAAKYALLKKKKKKAEKAHAVICSMQLYS